MFSKREEFLTGTLSSYTHGLQGGKGQLLFCEHSLPQYADSQQTALQGNQEKPNLHTPLLSHLFTHHFLPTRLDPNGKGLVLRLLLQGPVLGLPQDRNEATKNTARKSGNSLGRTLMP